MITGFNTDIEHDGVVYHVQTEDKGLDSPLILSLVYSGGAILASKRSRYEDLIAEGFSEVILAERLKRQHRLICAAIKVGRLEELKRMGAQEPSPVSVETAAEREPVRQEKVRKIDAGAPVAPVASAEGTAPIVSEPEAQPVPYTVYDPRRETPLGESPTDEEGLRITLLDERDFRSGESLTLRIRVSYLAGNDDKPQNGTTVSVKVLGTTFRPQIYSMNTQRDGIAIISAEIPKFTSGRAAILIRVVANGCETEMRRVIHPN